MSQVIIAVIVTGVIVAAITWIVANQHRQKTYEAKIGSAEERSREIIDEALKIAETKKREALLEAKEESLKTKNELEKETKERRAELQRYEKRVLSKEENVEKKADALEKKEADLVRRENILGERTAEDIKIKIGSAYKRPEPDYMEVRGRNLVTGLPKTIKVSSEETEEALKESTMQIVEAIHGVLEKTPPELAADIADRGIVLTGGGSLLRGLEELIAEHTGINTMTAEDPMTAVAIGTGKYVEFLGGYRE